MKLAAIDIGSNAARLLISEVNENENARPVFTKLNLIRVPLRLGFDVFEKGEITFQRSIMLMQTMKAFGFLLKAYNVQHVKACATSAMRDAHNSADILKKVKLETGIQIEIISGDKEAAMVYENHVAENLDKEHAYVYIDVGGGSTELSFFSEARLKYKESINIGTIRLLKNMVDERQWNEFRDKIRSNIKSKLPVIAIGSGGNINKIFSLSKKKDGKPLSFQLLKDYYKELSNFSVEERIRLYKMKDDRADVIVPALQIYVNVMRWADIEEIYVPKIGLADGLIQHLYEEVVRTGI
ncbi:MAG: exopolyphosphatase [Parafilimonas sp.]|nr:exopolyphosphatase [Parafilimonas sp.]